MAKYKFKLKHLNIKNNFSERQVKLFYRSVLGLILLFLATYIPITAYNNHKEETAALESSQFKQASSRAIQESPKVIDFQFPGDFLNFDAAITPSRPYTHRWAPAETDFFWVAPGDMGISNLPNTNHDLLINYLLEVADDDKNF